MSCLSCFGCRRIAPGAKEDLIAKEETSWIIQLGNRGLLSSSDDFFTLNIDKVI